MAGLWLVIYQRCDLVSVRRYLVQARWVDMRIRFTLYPIIIIDLIIYYIQYMYVKYTVKKK